MKVKVWWLMKVCWFIYGIFKIMLAECIKSKVLEFLTEVNKNTLLWTRAFGPFIGSVFNLVGEELGEVIVISRAWVVAIAYA